MATQPSTVEFIVEQMANAGTVTARKMFGEYALYCEERLVALVCDDKLFIKPTTAGRAFMGQVTEAPPYKGAKPYLFVSGEQWDDRDWLAQLVKVSAAELPLPVKKAPSTSPKKRPVRAGKS
jgi:TfoX/Sxy family transcriptional regulator of competence genes